MKYGITLRIPNHKSFIELTPDEFDAARTARSCLMHGLYTEEKLNYVLDNFVELECDLLDLAIDDMLFTDFSWSKAAGGVHLINRRLVNLLAACRLYIDHVAHHVSEIYGRNSAQSRAFKQSLSAEYDSHLGYRACEQFRNYLQHRGLLCDRLERSGRQIRLESGVQIQHTTIPTMNVEMLAEDTGVKVSVLDELREIGSVIDLRPLIRVYVESIGRVHKELRQAMFLHLRHWEEVIDDIHKRFPEASKRSGRVIIVAVDDSGTRVEQHSMFRDFVERMKELRQKNDYFMTECASHFVTSDAGPRAT